MWDASSSLAFHDVPLTWMRRPSSIFYDEEKPYPAGLDKTDDQVVSLLLRGPGGIRTTAITLFLDWGAAQRMYRAVGHTAPAERGSCIVKCISQVRAYRAAENIVRYIARLEPNPPTAEDRYLALDELQPQPGGKPTVYDALGIPIPRDEILDRFGAWGLLRDNANLSTEALQASRLGERIQDWPPECRLRRVQVRHLTLSLPGPTRHEVASMEYAVIATVRGTFVRWGHPAFISTHVDHGGFPHTHVVVRNYSWADGRALPFDRGGELLDAFRLKLAANARSVNIDAEGSRRFDRPEVMNAVRAGTEYFPAAEKRRQGVEGQARPSLSLCDRAPKFCAELRKRKAVERAAAEARKFNPRTARTTEPEKKGALRTATGLLRSLFGRRGAGSETSAELVPLRDALRALEIFVTPSGDHTEVAVRRFSDLYREAPDLAAFYMRRRPSVFAPVRKGAALITKKSGLLWRALAPFMPRPGNRHRSPVAQTKTESAQRRVELQAPEPKRQVTVWHVKNDLLALARRHRASASRSDAARAIEIKNEATFLEDLARAYAEPDVFGAPRVELLSHLAEASRRLRSAERPGPHMSKKPDERVRPAAGGSGSGTSGGLDFSAPIAPTTPARRGSSSGFRRRSKDAGRG